MWLARFATIGSMLLPGVAGAAPLFDVGSVSCSGTQNLSFTDGISLTCSGDLALIGGSIVSDSKIFIQVGGSLALNVDRVVAPVVHIQGAGGKMTSGSSSLISGSSEFSVGGFNSYGGGFRIELPNNGQTLPVLPAVVAVTGPPNVFPSTSVSGALVMNSGVATGQGVPNGTLVANVRTEPRYIPGNDPLGISGGRISTSGVRISTDSWGGTTPTLTVQSGPPAVASPNVGVVRPTPPAVPMPPIRDTSPPASVPEQPPIEPVRPVVQRRAGPINLLLLMHKPVVSVGPDPAPEPNLGASLTFESSRVAFATTASVPEPGTWLFALLGAGAMAGALRRSRR